MPADRFTQLFLEHLEVERNVSPRTLANYRHALERFREGVAQPAWKELRADHFRRYLFEQMKAGLAKPTVRLHFAAGSTTSADITFLVTNNGRESLSPKCTARIRGLDSEVAAGIRVAMIPDGPDPSPPGNGRTGRPAGSGPGPGERLASRRPPNAAAESGSV